MCCVCLQGNRIECKCAVCYRQTRLSQAWCWTSYGAMVCWKVSGFADKAFPTEFCSKSSVSAMRFSCPAQFHEASWMARKLWKKWWLLFLYAEFCFNLPEFCLLFHKWNISESFAIVNWPFKYLMCFCKVHWHSNVFKLNDEHTQCK